MAGHDVPTPVDWSGHVQAKVPSYGAELSGTGIFVWNHPDRIATGALGTIPAGIGRERSQGRVEPTQDTVEVRAGVCTDTVVKMAKAYAERNGNTMDTVTRKKRLTPPVPAKATGEVEARLVALAYTKPSK